VLFSMHLLVYCLAFVLDVSLDVASTMLLSVFIVIENFICFLAIHI
jgi:hypothetical protein